MVGQLLSLLTQEYASFKKCRLKNRQTNNNKKKQTNKRRERLTGVLTVLCLIFVLDKKDNSLNFKQLSYRSKSYVA